jgi:glycolate oxidase iron-sulfur subunit
MASKGSISGGGTSGLAGFIGPDAPAEEDLYKCVHCGFCLQACPTYVETGLETESPRGRIALMKAVNEGRIGLDEDVYRHWDMCIQCRACEDVCPSGVPYGRLIEKTMVQVEMRRKVSRLGRLVSWLILGKILPGQSALTGLVGALRLYQKSGLQRVVRISQILKLVPGGVAELESSLPVLPNAFFAAQGQVYHAHGKPRASVALLSGCVMPLIHGPEMRTVARVLNRNGVEVVVPQSQVCCGAIHTHVGDIERTRELARRNVDAFLALPVDAVITASAGCGTRMKEYGDLLADDPDYAERAAELSAKVRDIHEYLHDLPIEPPKGRLDFEVTYQDACHLTHTQGIGAQPRALLKSIPGLTLVEMQNSTRCCGAGGTYTVTQREMSLRLLDDKMTSISQTGATVVATGNPGCLMQLQYGAQRNGPPVTVKYVTDLLDEAYTAEKSVGTKAQPPKQPGSEDSPWEEERDELRTQWKSRPGDRRQRRDR